MYVCDLLEPDQPVDGGWCSMKVKHWLNDWYHFIFLIFILAFFCLYDKSEMDRKVQQREGRTCSKGPRAGIEPVSLMVHALPGGPPGHPPWLPSLMIFILSVSTPPPGRTPTGAPHRGWWNHFLPTSGQCEACRIDVVTLGDCRELSQVDAYRCKDLY